VNMAKQAVQDKLESGGEREGECRAEGDRRTAEQEAGHPGKVAGTPEDRRRPLGAGES
jgi:hypothetical protein